MNRKEYKYSFLGNIGFLMIISAILIIIIIKLWYLDYKNESIFGGLLVFAFWTFREIFNRHFQNIDRKMDEQKENLLQGTQAGFEFKQIVMTRMYDIISELWKRSIWIAQNWGALWPGKDSDKEIRSKFNVKRDHYIKFLINNAINIPSNI